MADKLMRTEVRLHSCLRHLTEQDQLLGCRKLMESGSQARRIGTPAYSEQRQIGRRDRVCDMLLYGSNNRMLFLLQMKQPPENVGAANGRDGDKSIAQCSHGAMRQRFSRSL